MEIENEDTFEDEEQEDVEVIKIENNDDTEEINSQLADMNLSSKPTISEVDWHKRFVRDFGDDLVATRPSPLPWYLFYMRNIKVDPHRYFLPFSGVFPYHVKQRPTVC